MRWFETLKSRILLGSLFLLILFGMYSYFSVRFYTDQMMSQVLESANRVSDAVKRTTRYSMLLNRKEDVYEIIRTMGRQPGIQGIRIYNKRGEIMFSTDSLECGKVVDLNAEACYVCHDKQHSLEPAAAGNRTRIYSVSDGRRLLGLINPIRNEQQCSNAGCHVHAADKTVLGVLDVRMSLDKVDTAMADAQQRFVLVALALLVIGTVAFFFLLSAVLRPVENLMNAARQISIGNLENRIPIRRNDEIGQLAQSFNAMVQSLQQAQTENREWAMTLEKRVREKTAELSGVHQQILQIEKMTSLGKLAATVAHELNNPLGGILTYAKLISRRLQKIDPRPSEVQQTLVDIDIIQRETARCGNIVKNLLLFSKKQAMDFEHVSVSQIIEKARQIVQHHFDQSNVRFEQVIPEEEITLFCDENQIQQALVALFINAVEAMPGGGTLTVRVEPQLSDGGLRLLVTDTGIGISKEDLPHIFEPFYTTKKDGQGVGLGLSVAYGILERHDGKVSVESEVGKGTTFVMEFTKAGAERLDGTTPVTQRVTGS
jgi:two-component system NtrC family sensor kinase